MADIKKFAEELVNLTVKEVQELANILKEEYGIGTIKNMDSDKKYEAVILAVAHEEFKDFDFEKYYKFGAVIFDAKAVVDRQWVDGRL
jgi:UDP-N-acetyl-D-galactosamine dehydrogenase